MSNNLAGFVVPQTDDWNRVVLATENFVVSQTEDWNGVVLATENRFVVPQTEDWDEEIRQYEAEQAQRELHTLSNVLNRDVDSRAKELMEEAIRADAIRQFKLSGVYENYAVFAVSWETKRLLNRDVMMTGVEHRAVINLDFEASQQALKIRLAVKD
ncbi:hypothetical protein DPMN_124576 [Dreissena polymorpha]|uniref:Uncharacterized protein n=1 Tax=Dreissena polymorpha TaxID=45954 RepID=A0A9D4I9J9_DREPO|nr:hypothetical protein DPMN_187959 [Dreissena polymorpha]KAH3822785.1 hypothetical protein DPMN_124576 [Dreissena polymorpha]